MNAGQSYLGKGGIATSFEQSAHSTPQSAQNSAKTPQLPDRWQTFQPEIRKAQSELLDLVNSYAEYTNPIVAINEILERWLMANGDELTNAYYKEHLVSVLRLITFLTELRDTHQKLVDRYEVYKEEVSNG